MASELEQLRERAAALAAAAPGRPEAERAGRLAERLGAGRFLIAVAGEFNRGKSTLINALIGDRALPTGVVPVTAVATEVSYGDPEVVVTYLDGRRSIAEVGALGEYVTEAANPGNCRAVARVEVRGPWALLRSGLVLVDTPGVASLHRHNTEAGHQALLDADAAVVVFSADAPLSEHEHQLLSMVAARRSATFFVLNKADHLSPSELEEVRAFMAAALSKTVGGGARLFAVDARGALAAGDSGTGMEFESFRDELWTFVASDLLATRLASAREELARLGSSLASAVAVERAARKLSAEQLDELVERFSIEAASQRRGFEDDRSVLARELTELTEAIGRHLSAFGHHHPEVALATLTDTAARTPRRRLADELGERVREAVEEAFERFRREELADVEQRWHQVAGEFRRRVAGRIDSARQAAAELFDVPLPAVEIPEIATLPDRFSFLFVHVEGLTEPLSRALWRLIPDRWARRKALQRAGRDLLDEFDKHAGRTRWDFAQRLEAASRELERSMRGELEHSICAIVQAAERARRRQHETSEDHERKESEARRLEALGADLVALSARVS